MLMKRENNQALSSRKRVVLFGRLHRRKHWLPGTERGPVAHQRDRSRITTTHLRLLLLRTASGFEGCGEVHGRQDEGKAHGVIARYAFLAHAPGEAEKEARSDHSV